MTNKRLVAHPPTGILRRFLRLPIVMYRYGLGGLLGGRFMLIHHIGRKSGQVRDVVVEVVSHDKITETYYVASGWGYSAQWYQNLVATPNVNIQVGRRNLAVKSETLSPIEGAAILKQYREKHPFTANHLGQVMGLELGQASIDDLVNIARESLPIVAFHPMTEQATY